MLAGVLEERLSYEYMFCYDEDNYTYFTKNTFVIERQTIQIISQIYGIE
ncbi:MAG TPA: hypothetical protein PLN63_05860 [Paludibacteraceae bacterium]|nr:hypothetical protein [Paludibacteraceae bacterium]HPH63126.1 hypothetical protein [Paludibacteraceae bacterium]